jgi:hypothetical protein
VGVREDLDPAWSPGSVGRLVVDERVVHEPVDGSPWTASDLIAGPA